MRVTNKSYINMHQILNGIVIILRLVQVSGLEEQNDGNNVNLDSQMSEHQKQ